MINCGFAEMGLGEYFDALKKEAYDQKIPFKGVFELTPRCNMNCQMCYVHLRPDQIPAIGRELTTEEWIDLGRQARDAGMVELTITGGEPMVRSDFKEIYAAYTEMGFLIQLYTNGYALDDDMVAFLAERPPYMLRFTMYGFSDETYEKVCGVKHGFTRIIEAMNRLRRAGLPFYMVSTITKDNQADLPYIASFAEENHIPFTYTTELIKPVRGADSDVERYQIEYPEPTKEQLEELLKTDNRKKPHARRDNLLEICGNYRKGFWLTWNGKIQLCSFLTEPAVSVIDGTSFLKAWEVLLERLQELRQPEKCQSCKYEGYCSRCYGSIYAASGSCHVLDPSLCTYAKRMYSIYESENIT